MPADLSALYHLAVALAIGLLIGAERGWNKRDVGEGHRIAGLRTYGLLGLLGGVGGLLASQLGVVLTGLMFIGIAGVLVTVYAVNLRQRDDVGITSMVAALLTWLLGVVAGNGQLVIAAASAVVMALLLSYKTLLHGWLAKLQAAELKAGLKLLLISVVMLPLLPDRGYGPWQALNPYQLWWMVVLIAAISFVGYFAMRIGGARRGLMFTGLAAGLASSTALTLHFSRLARLQQQAGRALSAGILLGSGTMFPRMLLVAGIVHMPLLQTLWLPALSMMLIIFIAAAVVLWQADIPKHDLHENLSNPLELRVALLFGLLLALVMLLGKALRERLGDAGIWALAAASGMADVDAITLSLAQMSKQDLALALATGGITVAAAVNTLVKAGMASIIGGKVLLLHAGLPMLLAALTGLVIIGWQLT
ncbi:MAG: MgtC/SapB family protein [Gammaproteobacteria bacterium]|nr:MgtC/SapB family protein [Gammaproteobacteria bacterium]